MANYIPHTPQQHPAAIPTATSDSTTKREYSSLADYASAHHAPTEAFRLAGWQQVTKWRRPALQFSTATGPRWRFIDGDSPTYIHDTGYDRCWYGLARAIDLATNSRPQPLILCNGEASTVVAQHYNLAACCVTSGEKAIPPALLTELQEQYNGAVIVVFDCDTAGRKAAAVVVEQLRAAGFPSRAVDLGGADGYDLADFCGDHGAAAVAMLSTLDTVTAPATATQRPLRPTAPVVPSSTTARTTTARSVSSDLAERRKEAYAQAAFTSEIDSLRHVTEGGRNNALFKVAVRLFGFADDGMLDDGKVEQALRDATDLPEKEVSSVLHSARQRAEKPTLPDFDQQQTTQRTLTPPADSPDLQLASLQESTENAADSPDLQLASLRTELLRYKQLEKDVWRILSAPKRFGGWKETTKLVELVAQMHAFTQQPENDFELPAIDGGATVIAATLDMSESTVGTHLNRLANKGLVEWHHHKVLKDKDGRIVDKAEAEGRNDLHHETVSTVHIKPLPDVLPALEDVEREKVERTRAEANRARIGLAAVILAKAYCPNCGDDTEGELVPTCRCCGEQYTKEHPLVRGVEWEQPEQVEQEEDTLLFCTWCGAAEDDCECDDSPDLQLASLQESTENAADSPDLQLASLQDPPALDHQKPKPIKATHPKTEAYTEQPAPTAADHGDHPITVQQQIMARIKAGDPRGAHELVQQLPQAQRVEWSKKVTDFATARW